MNKRKLFEYNTFYFVTIVFKALIRLWIFRYWSRSFIELNIHYQSIYNYLWWNYWRATLSFGWTCIINVVGKHWRQAYTKLQLKKRWEFRNVSKRFPPTDNAYMSFRLHIRSDGLNILCFTDQYSGIIADIWSLLLTDKAFLRWALRRKPQLNLHTLRTRN